MAEQEKALQGGEGNRPGPEPRGFGEHSRGLAGEYAHEQGWGLNEEERKATPAERQPEDGGTDYEYGAQDFGDTPEDTSGAVAASTQTKAKKME
jgi:hypothetical protein